MSNSLLDKNPKLASEWHPTKNESLATSDVTCGSDKRVWWQCARGHEWKARIWNRNNGNGCPYCSGLRVDLLTANPRLASEWHPTKNGNLTINDVNSSSHKKVWWMCSYRHEWNASINNRNNKGSGCPYCSGLRVIKGETDLLTTNPRLASEWHPTKNESLTTSDVARCSGKKVWWQCSHRHEWKATISGRNNGNGCPYCSGRRVI